MGTLRQRQSDRIMATTERDAINHRTQMVSVFLNTQPYTACECNDLIQRTLTKKLTAGSPQHFLRLKVCFPGIGNNLQADIPIRITSGMVTPTEAEAPAYDGPPPALNLPPYVPQA